MHLSSETYISCMNDSKWERLFDFLREALQIEEGRIKVRSLDKVYSMFLYVMEEDRRYSEDGIAGPIKLSDIEWLRVPIQRDEGEKDQAFCEALAKVGQFEYVLETSTVCFYGYKCRLQEPQHDS